MNCATLKCGGIHTSISLPDTDNNRKVTIITQPGMRYSQADAIVSNILQDKKFNELSVFDKSRVIDRLRSEIMGRMMEEILKHNPLVSAIYVSF